MGVEDGTSDSVCHPQDKAFQQFFKIRKISLDLFVTFYGNGKK